MNPSANAFTPGQGYEVPSSWGRRPVQQPKVRDSSVASVLMSGDYSDLPPVIHRFQKPTIGTPAISRNINESTGAKRVSSNAFMSLHVDPDLQSPLRGATHSTAENRPLANIPFQVVNRTKPSKSLGPSPQRATQMIKGIKDNGSEEVTGEDACKSYTRKITNRQLQLIFHNLVSMRKL